MAGPDELILTNMIIADCGRAVTLRFGGEGDDKTAYLRNSFISAISRPTCSQCYGSSAIGCSGNHAVRMLAVTVNGETMPSKFGAGYDTICKQESFDSKAFLHDVTF